VRAPVQDYCGVLTEDSLRKNFVLVYELLDEMVDFGQAKPRVSRPHLPARLPCWRRSAGARAG